MLQRFHYGLAGVLAVCLALRVAVWLITPIISVLIGLFVMTTVSVLVFKRMRALS